MRYSGQIIVLCCLIGVAIPMRTAASASEPDISVVFDRDAILAGEAFRLDITVETEGNGEPEIVLPAFEGFEVVDKRVSRPFSGFSMSIQMGTGRQAQRIATQRMTTRYTLVLKGVTPGTFRIGPVVVKQDGRTWKGKVYPVEVFDGGGVTSTGNDADRGTASSEHVAISDADLQGARLDPRYFLHMVPSRRTLYEGDMLILDVYLFTSVGNIQLVRFDKEAGGDGFWVEDFEDFDLRNHRNRAVEIDGTAYEQVLISRKAMFPQKSGRIMISPAQLTFSVGGGGFFIQRGREVSRTAAPVFVDVRELPVDDRPVGFVQGHVGQYSLFMDVSDTEVSVGDPVTVTLSVRGSGNIQRVQLPQIPDITGAKMYSPETDVEMRAAQGKVGGLTQSKQVLIPSEKGDLEIPAISWSWFDPQDASYKTTQTDPVTIRVTEAAVTGGGRSVSTDDTGASDNSGNGAAAGGMASLNASLRTIDDEVVLTMRRSPFFMQPWYVAVLVVCPLAVGFQWTGQWILRRRRRHGGVYRQKNAARKAFRALKHETCGGRTMSQEQFFAVVHRILMVFLEERFSNAFHGATMGEILEQLKTCGVEEGVAEKAVGQLEAYEFARFSRIDEADRERDKHVDQARELIGELDKVVGTTCATRRSGGA